MVVILILGGPTESATPTTQILVNHPSSSAPHVSHYGHGGSGNGPYQRIYHRSASATNASNSNRYGYRCYQKTPSHEETSCEGGTRNKYKSLSVPQLSLGQRFDTHKSHPNSTTSTTTKANQCHVNSDTTDEPLIRHITRVNICDASSSQLDLANSNYGAIATTDAEPVTREGEYKSGNYFGNKLIPNEGVEGVAYLN